MASEAKGVSGLAGRYATALFELAAGDKALERVAADLARLGSMIAESGDLKALILSPAIGRADQARAIDAVIARAEFSALTRRFVGVVARARRLFALPLMIRDFRILLARQRGEVGAEVTSAAPLDDKRLAAVREALRQATGSEVTLETRVDPSLLGGLIVRVGSRMVDSSLGTKLQKLQLAMKGAR